MSDKQNINIGKLSLEEYNKLAPTTQTTGKVIIKCTDTEGNSLKEDQIITGPVGDIYITTRPEISAFKPYGNDPINKIGNYDKNDITVSYIYQRKTDNVNINNEDNVITVQILNEQTQEIPEVKMSIVAEDENGEVITGGKYLVTDENDSVIRNATSYAEKLLIGAIPLTSEGTDKSKIKEVNAPEGYAPLDENVQVQVIKTLDGGNYNIAATQVTSNEDVRVELINGEIVITIKHKKAKVFDLKIENQVAELTVSNENTEEKITKQSAEEIIKVDIPSSKINNTVINAKYAITITNVGELAGYAKEISNIIPEGMELVEGGNWTVSGNTAINTGLENNLLQPGESITLYINLKWKLSENSIGLRTDKVKITNSIGEGNTADTISSNDSAEDSFMVSVRTGYSNIIFIAQIVLIGLIIITIIVGIIRKRN